MGSRQLRFNIKINLFGKVMLNNRILMKVKFRRKERSDIYVTKKYEYT